MKGSNPEIAVVDDERNVVNSIRIGLEHEGFEVRPFYDGREALDSLQKNPASLAIIDIAMPKMSGMELFDELNRRGIRMPIVFLTSNEEEWVERLALKNGAADYITKPYSLAVLIHRVKAVLYPRQISNGRAPDKARLVEVGRLTLNLDGYYCSWDGHRIDLTIYDFRILQALAGRPNIVRSREDLAAAASSTDYHEPRHIDSYVKRIRKKFREVDNDFDQISSHRGIGYRWDKS